MNQEIQLGALVLSEGRLLLVGESIGGPWGLIGGPLRPEHPDTETAMDEMLAEFGVAAPAIEEDFVETLFFTSESSRLVFNLYAPTEWTGQPSAPDGTHLRWVDPAEVAELEMDARIRDALLQLFGLKDRPDNDTAIMDAMRGVSIAASTPDVAGGTRGGAASLLAAEFESQLDARWGNDDLSPRTRAIVNVALASAQRVHTEQAMGDALQRGVSAGEISEALRIVALFAGHPAALEASEALARALARLERGANG